MATDEFKNIVYENKDYDLSVSKRCLSWSFLVIVIVAAFYCIYPSEFIIFLVFYSSFFFLVFTMSLIVNYFEKNPLKRIIVTENSTIAEYKNEIIELFYEDVEFFSYNPKSSYILEIHSKNPLKKNIKISGSIENHEHFFKFIFYNYIPYNEYCRINK